MNRTPAGRANPTYDRLGPRPVNVPLTKNANETPALTLY
jgi:hypothetical protein